MSKVSRTGLSPRATAKLLSAEGIHIDERAIGEFRDLMLAVATPINDENDLADLVKLAMREYKSIRKRDVNHQELKCFWIEDKAEAATGKKVKRSDPDAFDDFISRYSVTEQFGIVARFRIIYSTTNT